MDDGEPYLDVCIKTITCAQIAQLFRTGIPAIPKYIRHIFQSGELKREATVSKMEMVRQEGSAWRNINIRGKSFFMFRR